MVAYHQPSRSAKFRQPLTSQPPPPSADTLTQLVETIGQQHEADSNAVQPLQGKPKSRSTTTAQRTLTTLHRQCRNTSHPHLLTLKQQHYASMQQFLDHAHRQTEVVSDTMIDVHRQKLQAVHERQRVEQGYHQLLNLLHNTSDLRRIDKQQLHSILEAVNHSAAAMKDEYDDDDKENSSHASQKFYQMVAVIGNRFFDIGDASVEYVVGEQLQATHSRQDGAASGFQISSTMLDALTQQFPADKPLAQCPRALLQVHVPITAQRTKQPKHHTQLIVDRLVPERVVVRFGQMPHSIDHALVKQLLVHLDAADSDHERQRIFDRISSLLSKPAFKP